MPASGMPPHGLLAKFPNLKAIINLGAGVDHLLADPDLPRFRWRVSRIPISPCG